MICPTMMSPATMSPTTMSPLPSCSDTAGETTKGGTKDAP